MYCTPLALDIRTAQFHVVDCGETLQILLAGIASSRATGFCGVERAGDEQSRTGQTST